MHKPPWFARHRRALALATTAALPVVVYSTYTLLGSLALGLSAQVVLTAIVSVGTTLPISNLLSAVDTADRYEQSVRLRIGSDGLAIGDIFIAWSRFVDVQVANEHIVIRFAPEQQLQVAQPGNLALLTTQVRRAKRKYDQQAPPLSAEDLDTVASTGGDHYRHANRATLLQAATNTRAKIALRVASARALRDDAYARAIILASLENIVCDAHWHLIHDALSSSSNRPV